MEKKRAKTILDSEELALQKLLQEGIRTGTADLWPAVRNAIVQEESHSLGKFLRTRQGFHFPKRAWAAAAVLVLTLGLMGAGILRHWFVYDSNGNVTALTESEGFHAGEEYALMSPAAEGETAMAPGWEIAEEVYYHYDWPDDPAFIPGGLLIPGNTASERDLPELKEKLAKLPAGTYAEIRANGKVYTAVQGSWRTPQSATVSIRSGAQSIRSAPSRESSAAILPSDTAASTSSAVRQWRTRSALASISCRKQSCIRRHWAHRPSAGG